MSVSTVINVKNHVYCEIEIEADYLPPSLNTIESIDIFDGFGIALPTLQVKIYDNDHNLTSQLSLNDATKITVTLAKDDTKPVRRAFRVFGYKRENGNEGPLVTVGAILDAPKWSAGVYREAFSKSPSMDAISQLASSAGLKFDGPTSATNDRMTWLNINQTRSSFAEDVAMRGYVNGGSCMSRLVTMDGNVRYKDIIKQLLGSPVASLLLNTEEENAAFTPVHCSQGNNRSSSGVIAHWFNYGYEQFEHNLSGEQVSSASLDAPVLGSALPINKEVKGMLDGARVTYVGFDPGTEPLPASNLHEFYERAYYQNLRYLGLFTERMRLLSDQFTELESFDCVEYLQTDHIDHKGVPNKGISGKYLLGGKGIHVKNGHWYHESFDLYRPYIQEAGASNMMAPSDAGSGGSTVNANDGSIPLPPGPDVDSTAQPIAKPNAASAAAKPAIKSAIELLQALSEYDEINPAIPTKPLPLAGTPVDPKVVEVQDKLRSTQQEVKRGPLSGAFDHETPRTLEGHATLKKIDKASVDSAMKRAAGLTDDPPPELQTLAIERYSETGSDQMQVEIESVVASNSLKVEEAASMDPGTALNADGTVAAGETVDIGGKKVKVTDQVIPTAGATTTQNGKTVLAGAETATSTKPKFTEGSVVGDVNSGGFHEADLQANDIAIPEGTRDEAIVSTVAKSEEAGVQMIEDPTATGKESAGYGFDFKPKEAAKFFEGVSKDTDPDKFLAEKGPEDYIQLFGAVSNEEANADLALLGKESAKVQNKFGDPETLVDTVKGGDAGKQSALGSGLVLEYGSPGLTPTANIVSDVSEYVGDDATKPSFKDSVKILKSTREVMPWPDLFSFGNDRSKEECAGEFGPPPPGCEEGNGWEWPFDFPEHTPELSEDFKEDILNLDIDDTDSIKDVLKEGGTDAAKDWGKAEYEGSELETYVDSEVDRVKKEAKEDGESVSNWFGNLFSEESEEEERDRIANEAVEFALEEKEDNRSIEEHSQAAHDELDSEFDDDELGI